MDGYIVYVRTLYSWYSVSCVEHFLFRLLQHIHLFDTGRESAAPTKYKQKLRI